MSGNAGTIRADESGLVDALVAFSWEREARGRERADVLARLRMKRANAIAAGQGNPAEAERAAELVRHLEVEIDYLTQGLHVGAAAVAEALGFGAGGFGAGGFGAGRAAQKGEG